MSYEFYKLIHVVGILSLFTGIAFLAAWSLDKNSLALKKWGSILHGAGLLIVLVSGFGLAARLGLVQGLPNWIYAKLAIWLALGAFIALIKRKSLGLKSSLIAIAWAAVAAYLAINKPF